MGQGLKGWKFSKDNSRLEGQYEGSRAFHIDANGLTVPSGKTLSVTTASLANLALAGSGLLNLGALEEPTIASGVLTVTRPFVNPLPESSTADQVDSIVYTGAVEGTLLIIHVPATNTITFDDANINLGAATRAVAPGGSLILVYDGTQWTELTFLAAADNA